ncbi:MAG TPA: hypothetical protein VF585_07970 [Chthoniobacterales bacterium]|jgi:hypothetical protein
MIYVFQVADDVPILLPSEDANRTEFHLEAKPMLDVWEPPKVKVLNPDWSPCSKLRGDCYWLWSHGDAPVVSERAKELFSQVKNLDVEFLPIPVGDRCVYLMNVLTQLECIDFEKSHVRYFF